MLMRQWLVRHRMAWAASVVETLDDALARLDDNYDNCKAVLRADLRHAHERTKALVRETHLRTLRPSRDAA